MRRSRVKKELSNPPSSSSSSSSLSSLSPAICSLEEGLFRLRRTEREVEPLEELEWVGGACAVRATNGRASVDGAHFGIILFWLWRELLCQEEEREEEADGLLPVLNGWIQEQTSLPACESRERGFFVCYVLSLSLSLFVLSWLCSCWIWLVVYGGSFSVLVYPTWKV